MELIFMKVKRTYLIFSVAVLIITLFIVFTFVKDVEIDLEYQKMMDNSGEYLNRTFNLKGQSFEVVDEGDNKYSMYLFTRKKELEYDDDVIYLTGYTGENVKNEQIISCKAVFVGMTGFTLKSGESRQIPELQYTK